jgi:predicted porin
MKSKIVAAAVGAALAAPGLALAQTVTIGGYAKLGLENISIGDRTAPGTHSENRFADQSSRIVFNASEDLGGGLSAIMQMDNRFQPDSGGGPAASGNTWIGLRGASWGQVTFGRHDLHYGKAPSAIADNAGAFKAQPIGIFDYIDSAPVALGTRTPNSMKFDSVEMSGFRVTAAYSTNAGAASEGDINSTVRAGSAWNLNPSFSGQNFKLELSLWNSQPDLSGGASYTDQTGTTLAGWYRTGALRIGFGYNSSALKTTTVATGVQSENKRTAFSIPIDYLTGVDDFHFHYTVAQKRKLNGAEVADSGAKMMALSYVHHLSKRVSLGATYVTLTNDPAASYRLFGDDSATSSSTSLNAQANAGEKPKLIALTMKYGF